MAGNIKLVHLCIINNNLSYEIIIIICIVRYFVSMSMCQGMFNTLEAEKQHQSVSFKFVVVMFNILYQDFEVTDPFLYISR